MSTPQPGHYYKHFKGNIYVVLCTGRHSETLEDMVVYRNYTYESTGNSEDILQRHTWVRPLSEWIKRTPDGIERFVELPRDFGL